MTLQDKLDAFTKDLLASGRIPAPIVKELLAGIAEQVASGRSDRALKSGDKAHPFLLQDSEGATFCSGDLLARGPLILSFYRAMWCLYCNIELQALETARPQIEARGASLVALSMQTAVNSRKTARDNNLRFPILPPHLVELNRKLGTDLQIINGKDSWALPMPARYVVAQDGVVAYAEVNPDYFHRPEPTDLFPILDRLARSSAA